MSQDSSSNESETSKTVRFKGVEETSEMESPTCPTCHQVIARDTKDYDSLMEKSVTMVTALRSQDLSPSCQVAWERTCGNNIIIIIRYGMPKGRSIKDLVLFSFVAILKLKQCKHVAKRCIVCIGIGYQIITVFQVYKPKIIGERL